MLCKKITELLSQIHLHLYPYDNCKLSAIRSGKLSLFIEKDWNELIYAIAKQLKPKEAAVANKGQQFEIVVEELLHILFEDQELSFTPTKMSYDGSKDFWSIDDSYKLWWVECKNYRENISLTQLAPTLFMADLHEASYLLFLVTPNLIGISNVKLAYMLKSIIKRYLYLRMSILIA